MESCSSAFTALSPAGRSKAIRAVHSVAGVDVLQPRAVLAVGSSKVYVGLAAGAELPLGRVVKILRAVVKGLRLGADVGNRDVQDRVPALSRVPEPH